LDNLEAKFKCKFKIRGDELVSKADLSELEIMRERIEELERSKEEQERTAIMKESYEKRLNLLIHGLAENADNAWELPKQTLCHVHEFKKECLCIEDPISIQFVNYHRLPQYPIYRDHKLVTRPIIIKLMNVADKRKIYDYENLKNLKIYNQNKRASSY